MPLRWDFHIAPPPASFLLTDYPMRIVILSERSESKDLSSNLQHLTSFHSITCALFPAMEHSQPLCYQSLPHSFPCNRGWGGSRESYKNTAIGSPDRSFDRGKSRGRAKERSASERRAGKPPAPR